MTCGRCASHARSTASANHVAGAPKVTVSPVTLGGGGSLKTVTYADAISEAEALADQPGQRCVLVGLRRSEGQVAQGHLPPLFVRTSTSPAPSARRPTAPRSELPSARPSCVFPPVVPALTSRVRVLHGSVTCPSRHAAHSASGRSSCWTVT